jgi:hypothetical protein
MELAIVERRGDDARRPTTRKSAIRSIAQSPHLRSDRLASGLAVGNPVGSNWLSQPAVPDGQRQRTRRSWCWSGHVIRDRTRPGRRRPQGVDLDQLRRECLGKLGELGLELPTPFTIEAFCARLGVCLGRQIVLCPVNTTFATSTGPCGLWVRIQGADLFFYEQATSSYHKDHVLAHEAGHAAFGDPSTVVLDEDELAGLVGLSPVTVQRVRGRTSYDKPRERRAEVFGTVVNELAIRAGPIAPPTAPHSEAAAVLSRLQAALTGSRDPDVR